jgi:prophage PSPPH06, putative tail tape measure domain protein
MGNYRTTYIELDDFKVSCIQGYPYEGFVIGCGYAYVENIPSEMAILENSSYIYNPIKVQQIDTSLLAIIKSLHLTPDDIRNKLVSEKGDMYVLNIPEGPLTIPKKDSKIIITTYESDTHFNIKIEVKGRDINETYNYDYNNYYINRSSIELLKLLGTKDTSKILDKVLDYINKLNEQYHINDINDVLSGFSDGLDNTGKTRISNKFKLYVEKNNGYVFYGNQYVKTYSLWKIGKKLTVVTNVIGGLLDGAELLSLYLKEGEFGNETQKATAKIAGSYAGGALGAAAGAILGTSVVGLLALTGVGAVVAAFLAAGIGSYLGSEVGEDISVDIFEKIKE